MHLVAHHSGDRNLLPNGRSIVAQRLGNEILVAIFFTSCNVSDLLNVKRSSLHLIWNSRSCLTLEISFRLVKLEIMNMYTFCNWNPTSYWKMKLWNTSNIRYDQVQIFSFILLRCTWQHALTIYRNSKQTNRNYNGNVRYKI